MVETTCSHGNCSCEDLAKLRDYIKDQDIELRHPKSGSVPGLERIITPEQRAVLVADTVPAELLEDEKTAWYLGKLDNIMSGSLSALEAKFGVKTTQPVDCLANKQAIEASYKKAPIYEITILEDGSMEVENNGN